MFFIRNLAAVVVANHRAIIAELDIVIAEVICCAVNCITVTGDEGVYQQFCYSSYHYFINEICVRRSLIRVVSGWVMGSGDSVIEVVISSC